MGDLGVFSYMTIGKTAKFSRFSGLGDGSPKSAVKIAVRSKFYLDDRQITHLICVRLKHLLYDFLGGVLGLLPVVFLYRRPQTPPKKVIQQKS